MSDFIKAKTLAEELLVKREIQKREDCSNEDFDAWHEAEIQFEDEVGPQVFLDLMADRDALISELESLRSTDLKSGLIALAAFIGTEYPEKVLAAMSGCQHKGVLDLAPKKSALSFSEKLVQIRVDRGITRKDLSTICGMSYAMISKYETGKFTPRLERVISLEKALNCPGELQGARHEQ